MRNDQARMLCLPWPSGTLVAAAINMPGLKLLATHTLASAIALHIPAWCTAALQTQLREQQGRTLYLRLALADPGLVRPSVPADADALLQRLECRLILLQVIAGHSAAAYRCDTQSGSRLLACCRRACCWGTVCMHGRQLLGRLINDVCLMWLELQRLTHPLRR
jgi:hypothetical protein